jgi:Putative DNA-binding domain
MPRAGERQRAFAEALLAADRPVPARLLGPDGEPSPKRFAVYRNNVVVGLIDALRSNFPAVCRIVGDEFFRALARAYAIAHPPASPILLHYGAGFPDFIASFEPAAALPYLTDIARLECAWVDAYNSPEAEPLQVSALAAVAIECVSDIRFALHPSLRVVRSEFPALTIWRMNTGDGLPGPVDFDAGGEDALVLRPAADVEVRSMPAGGAEFIAALAGGRTLADAARSALDAGRVFDLSSHLAALISAGAFVGYRLPTTAPGTQTVAVES